MTDTTTNDLTDSRILDLSEDLTRNLKSESSTSTDGTVNETTSVTGNDAETGTRHRAGTMGWHTKQQMIVEDRDLWDWDYFLRIFEDVDRVLTLPIYDPCVLDRA